MSLATTVEVAATEEVHSPAYLVFCDVDETLISLKSMFDFLRFQLVRRHEAEGEKRYQRIAGELRRQSAAGAPRAEVNRAYYRAYAGESAAEMAQLGRVWFALGAADPKFFIASTVAELARHRAAGAEVVLVSGSFAPCLDPIAERVGAVHLLCTSPTVENGVYTGEVPEPVIGEGKRSAVLRMLAEHPGISPLDCFAVGDHPSDFPMLDCVGHPRGVGDDPAVREYLDRRREQSASAHPGRALACWSMGRDEHSEGCSGNCALPLD
ncbi:HAD superfamily hydrolase (TIGR01490 family) [Streptomyces sp. LBL]|uniref:HAD family hydrolase n=1 Tax=Streptomyces sp. LBL TaxID=2940562 RepID=UPI002475900C|nr:HAD-IB family hydrolase [Streptomyces sp. LBL]MDH6624482.1 HAD superfamily hydrolase (TIGR01490 family) [Streptomyces sp. LBL]